MNSPTVWYSVLVVHLHELQRITHVQLESPNFLQYGQSTSQHSQIPSALPLFCLMTLGWNRGLDEVRLELLGRVVREGVRQTARHPAYLTSDRSHASAPGAKTTPAYPRARTAHELVEDPLRALGTPAWTAALG